ncbi:MAG: gamma-glutamyltransferase, partial [Rhodospirillales bacterium]|nr:gamma-glutamyltransferase [Rhodospirillales bacterium]
MPIITTALSFILAVFVGSTANAQMVSTSEPVTASKYMAATANPYATDAALEVLRAGGSAVDAAIAAQMVLTLVEPQSSGIGGGAFMMYYDAAKGTVDAYDGREMAPASATATMFMGADGEALDFY